MTENRAEYDTGEEAAFAGFAPPTENWSKLPHALIEALPLIETLGEMKVILYTLRHTWGYHDTEKKITLDEFCNGRKRRDGSRIDNGTGLSKPTVIDGLERAIIHGFLTLRSDKSDLGRVKNFYSLCALDVKELDPTGKEPCHRTEKDTSERNLKKERPPAADSSPSEESFYLEGETPTAPRQPHTAEECKAGVARAIATFEEKGGRPGVADPTHEVDPWLATAHEFSALIVTPYENVPESKRGLWARDIREIAEDSETGKGPEEVCRAIRSISTCDAYDWLRTCNRPTHRGFADALLAVLCGQALPEGKRNGGSSTPRTRETNIIQPEEVTWLTPEQEKEAMREHNAHVPGMQGDGMDRHRTKKRRVLVSVRDPSIRCS